MCDSLSLLNIIKINDKEAHMKHYQKLTFSVLFAWLGLFFSLAAQANIGFNDNIDANTMKYSGNLLVVGSYINSSNPSTAALEVYFIEGNTYDSDFIRV